MDRVSAGTLTLTPEPVEKRGAVAAAPEEVFRGQKTV